MKRLLPHHAVPRCLAGSHSTRQSCSGSRRVRCQRGSRAKWTSEQPPWSTCPDEVLILALTGPPPTPCCPDTLHWLRSWWGDLTLVAVGRLVSALVPLCIFCCALSSDFVLRYIFCRPVFGMLPPLLSRSRPSPRLSAPCGDVSKDREEQRTDCCCPFCSCLICPFLLMHLHADDRGQRRSSVGGQAWRTQGEGAAYTSVSPASLCEREVICH